jgi:hypothetical protein
MKPQTNGFEVFRPPEAVEGRESKVEKYVRQPAQSLAVRVRESIVGTTFKKPHSTHAGSGTPDTGGHDVAP